MGISEFYASIGVDVNQALRRFASECLVHKYLHKLLTDSTFTQLTAAMEAGDGEEAFRAAHTPKGIALNLDLEPLIPVSEELTEALRDISAIPDGAWPPAEQLAAAYTSIVAKVKLLN